MVGRCRRRWSRPRSRQVALEGVVVDGDQEPGGGAVGLRRQVGVQGVLGGGHQGVPEPGAVVARVAVGPPRSPGRSGAGSGQVSGSSAAISRAPSSAEPRPRRRTPPARSAADGEVAVQVGGTFLTLQCGFEPAVDGVGVDHLGQVPAGLGELGGVEPSGLADAAPSPRGAGPGHRTAGPATARTMMSACTGDTVPSTSPRMVRASGPVSARARTTRCLPSPRRSPPVWVSQSPVEP